ncbi:HDOD domain-containing protein [Massilia sp. MB5]|uniref:HDOD domain-containing protein n=1 Tax=Massilia sp. MB5 TaxID=2919578 RepID=UPI001F0DD203|nr:HDOD domain-containing protein [Massilia sp. MB5]UMR28605.1 HDOD domain-containing protein [Massilia sp. MB5]
MSSDAALATAHGAPSAAEALRRLRDLPSLPDAVGELLALMQREDLDTRQLAERLALDQAVAARILRLANSSFYGLSARVTSLQQAIAVLGVHSIRTLVTAIALTGSLRVPPAAGFDLRAFWRHSLAAAAAARALAQRQHQSPDSAFTAGLLHDIGVPVLATSFPAEYAAMEAWRRAHASEQRAAEQACFGFDHAAVGAALAGHWHFPPLIQEAAARHHDTAWQARSPALTVHLANLLAHGMEPGPQAWQALNLERAAWLDSAAQGAQDCQAMCQVLLN